MLTQLHKYVNSVNKVKLTSSLPLSLITQEAQDNQLHPVIAFKPKPLSQNFTPENFAIWKDNFEVYFTTSNGHHCETKNQSVFLNTCIDEFLVSILKQQITDAFLISDQDIKPNPKKTLPSHLSRSHKISRIYIPIN